MWRAHVLQTVRPLVHSTSSRDCFLPPCRVATSLLCTWWATTACQLNGRRSCSGCASPPAATSAAGEADRLLANLKAVRLHYPLFLCGRVPARAPRLLPALLPRPDAALPCTAAPVLPHRLACSLGSGWRLIVLDTTEMSGHSGYPPDSEQCREAQVRLLAAARRVLAAYRPHAWSAALAGYAATARLAPCSRPCTPVPQSLPLIPCVPRSLWQHTPCPTKRHR